MTVSEAFMLWKTNECSKGLKCIYGGLEGGPGYLGFGACKNENHPDVRYGCKWCDDNCSDYVENSESCIFANFLAEYRNNPSYYNEKYNIDSNDKFYFESI